MEKIDGERAEELYKLEMNDFLSCQVRVVRSLALGLMCFYFVPIDSIIVSSAKKAASNRPILTLILLT